MYLTIHPDAQNLLNQYMADTAVLILTLNDGSNQFSSAEGCCMIGDRFLLVPVTQTIAPFILPVPTNCYTIFTSRYDTLFLTGNLQLLVDSSSGTLVLKNESSILDANVQIKKPLNL